MNMQKINSEVLRTMKFVEVKNLEESFQRQLFNLRNIELQYLFVYAFDNAVTIMR